MSEKNGEHPFGDLGQLILFVLFFVVWAADSFFLRKSTFLSTHIPLAIRFVASAIILGTSVYLVAQGHVVIDHRQLPKRLITTGIFAYVRHPLYLACVLFYLALAISTMSLVSLVLVAGIFIFYNFLASYEERLLEALFGEEYSTYKKRTGKWAPRVFRKT
jgi:protein-S-isoprenylcysteine O-methyltransferase Ste14